MNTAEILQKVLVVDDEPEIAEEMAELLADAGFDCVIRFGPREALDAIHDDSDISIVVTDLKMPGMDGLEMIKTIRDTLSAQRQIEVIVMTGHAGTDAAIEALRLGAVDFLTKPIAPDHLVHTVRRAAEAVELRNLERKFNTRLREKVKERTAELRKLNADLALANRVKSEFLTLISHELRTPLNAIIGFSEIMAAKSEKSGDQAQHKYSRKVSQAGNKLLGIVNTILDLIDVRTGDLELRKSDTDVVGLVERVIEVCRPRIDAKSIDLTVETPGRPIMLACDGARLTQAIGNVLDNAIQFTPSGSRIGVAVEASGGEVKFTVLDHGKGMTEDEIAVALDPFRQVDATLSKSHYGIGMGLTLSRMFVELHGGRLEIDSSPGAGTTVTMTIPVGER